MSQSYEQIPGSHQAFREAERFNQHSDIQVTDIPAPETTTNSTRHSGSLISKAQAGHGLAERMFTWMFKGLVYPQIWEDPEVDMEALAIQPDTRIITITSGGCNMLSYLTADPKEIIAVDLNTAHIALSKLKVEGVRRLPNYGVFYRFFAEANEKANLAAYKRFLKGNIDRNVEAYWEQRDMFRRKRITLFSRDLYQHGLLGYFIWAGHLIARAYGVNLQEITQTSSREEQRSFFEKRLAPLFDKRVVRWMTSKKVSLYGLGIPPMQYEALASAGNGRMSEVLKQRLENLACNFDLSENYFAWQAFGKRYGGGPSGPLPPYLKEANFAQIRERSDRISIENVSFTERLKREPDNSMGGYVLLDAQDWMNDNQLNELWNEITRTAAPGARVIFRTAAEPTLLPGRVADHILKQWDYRMEESLAFHARDRSSIYGGFHLYVFRG
ncbi:MAG: DUF3419 family protein [Rhizobiaceae bacterium]|jgi:S-adenosylmethionine-diacylglycerol 3-amino-3-carboxypropyl transferase|nr:DUF3419 family protein [Rhizobiaceae bacterium]